MNGMFENEPISLVEQITCVEREIAMRERVYPRLVKRGKMTTEKSAYEIRAMKAVLSSLKAKVEP